MTKISRPAWAFSLRYWFKAIKVQQFDDKGIVVRLVRITREITEHVRTKEELRKGNATLKESKEEYRGHF